MDELERDRAGQLPFIAELRPYRSLGPAGFFTLMAIISVVAFLTGMVFVQAGAWPVLGFFGLDVALIYLAFRLNYRSGRLYERVELDRNALTVTRVFPSGRRKSWSFNPYWVRFHFHDSGAAEPQSQRDVQVEDRLREPLRSEFRHRPQLKLASHGVELVFGHFLNDDEKTEFGQVLARAISSVRR